MKTALGLLSAVTTQCLCSSSKKVKASPQAQNGNVQKSFYEMVSGLEKKKSTTCSNSSKYSAPLPLWHTSVASSHYKGMIINHLWALILSKQQHFNLSCIPSLACMWEGVCLPCTTSAPCRQQGFVCVHCSELPSHSHRALWVCQKFARFSREKQVFQMPIDADFKWLTRTTKSICKEADRSRL